MARIDIERLGLRIARALHAELVACPLGPLGPDVEDAPDLTYQEFTMTIPLTAQGVTKQVIADAARALADAVKEAKLRFIAIPPLPDVDDLPERQQQIAGVIAPSREDAERWRLAVRVLLHGGTMLEPYGVLRLDIVGVPMLIPDHVLHPDQATETVH